MVNYKEQLRHISSESGEEREKHLNSLSESAKILKEWHWYKFLRGIILYDKGQIKEAVKLMEKAFSVKKEIYFCEEIIKVYSKLDEKAKVVLWNEKKENLSLYYRNKIQYNELIDREEDIRALLEKHAEGNKTVAEQYIKGYLNRDDATLGSERNFLKVLKEWSSSTPLMYQGIGRTENVGGGFFIKWKGKGIVIDPGLNFVQNLHRHNLSVLDIDLVIVTHNHMDHNSDLTVIMDIKYQCMNAIYNIRLDEEQKHAICRPIHWYVDQGTYDEYCRKFSENNCQVIQFQRNTNNKTKYMVHFHKYNQYISVEYFQTIHIVDGVSYAIVLDLKNDMGESKRIGFTSDTKYFPELADNLVGTDYLVANISEITLEDLEKRGYKENHLGYHGCSDLISNKEIYPTYFILSEFWGGKGDIRKSITEYLKIDSLSYEKEVDIIPGDTSLSFDLDDDSICCSGCQKFYQRDSIKVFNPPDKGLEYLCTNCRKKE